MMKFFAFLGDSFREARNGWVLQAMLVLAGLLVLFVASISFEPTTVQRTVETPLRFVAWTVRSNPSFSTTKMELENYTASNPTVPWQSDYAFDIVIRSDTPEEMKRLDENRGLPVSRARLARFLEAILKDLNEVKVEKSPSSTPTEQRFHVTSKGTKVQDVTAWPHVPKVLFAFEAPFFIMSLRSGVYAMQNYIIGGAGVWIVLLISVIITSMFIPNLLQKGAVDLAISKPVTRSELLIYKYFGGLTFTAILLFFTIGGSWLVIGLRTGIWNNQFLLMIPVILGYFAVLYAVSTLVAVYTRSAIVAILATILAWGGLFLVGKVNQAIVDRETAMVEQDKNPNAPLELGKDPKDIDPDAILRRIDPDAPLWGFIPKWSFAIFKTVHTILPRTYQLDSQMDLLVARGVLADHELKQAKLDKPVPAGWLEILGVSFAGIVFILGLACWRFSTTSF